MTHLSLTLPADKMFIFSPILQEGLKIQAEMGCSVKRFLCTTFPVSSEYIEERIPTIMLNGKVVEDLEGSIIEENAVLALSSAMPGLVGATLRRGGHLSTMRSGITYRENKKNQTPHRGAITIRFFNVLIRELGLKLLYQGITMSRVDLTVFIQRCFDPLKENCTNAMINNQKVTVVDLLKTKMLIDADEIFVQIKREMNPHNAKVP